MQDPMRIDQEALKRDVDEIALTLGNPKPRNRAERRAWEHSAAGRAVNAEIARRAAARAASNTNEDR